MEKALEIYSAWQNGKTVTKVDKLHLFNVAKDAYTAGDEIMSDSEFDRLENELSLENKSYVGSKVGNYTVKHSFIMGSLSKTQVKKDMKTGEVNWPTVCKEIKSAVSHSSAKKIETSPKLDGCSFSAEFVRFRDKAVLEKCATRGDGEYGTDLTPWFSRVLKTSYWDKINEFICSLITDTKMLRQYAPERLVIRGEILIPHKSFNEKYQQDFTNPRSFVAGCIGRKWEDTAEQNAYADELHFVCYDYRVVGMQGDVTEIEWIDDTAVNGICMAPEFKGHVGELPPAEFCRVYTVKDLTVKKLQEIYADYDDLRLHTSEYALDGVVIKPVAADRLNDLTRTRPQDCIAMKFMPMMEATTITGIEWTVGRDGEYTPIATIETVVLDNKNITHASLHNYNYILTHRAGIGAKVRISLAGDIIPFVYEIVTPCEFDADDMENPCPACFNMPMDAYVNVEKSGKKHLMKAFDEESLAKNKFLASAKSLGINNVGPATAEELWNTLHDVIPAQFPEYGPALCNIIQLIPAGTHDYIRQYLGDGKSIANVIDSLAEYGQRIELTDIIHSYSFKSCGHRASDLCAKIITGAKYSTASFPAVSYEWALNQESDEYRLVVAMAKELNVPIESTAEEEESADRIPIIMTGSPKACSPYQTKGEFLKAHPQYVETTSWKECKILFTDDLNSTSSKMKKAEKAGIPVKQYEA